VKVLIADDDASTRLTLEAMLAKWGYEVASTSDGQQAWDALQRPDAPTLAVLDWMMSGMDGVEVCSRVRAQARERYTYIILLTARDRKEDLIDGLEAGADDYLSKPFDAQELRVRLRTGRRILDLQSEILAARDTLQIQATHDSLTGLWNRAAVLAALGRDFARARREETPLAAALVDLDHFKRINDTHGHQAGDAVLREAARRMRASVRPYDSVGRYGGEEFLVVMPGCESVGAAAVAGRIRACVERDPMDLGARSLPVTCSIGVAVWNGAPEGDADSLIREADAALYRAKGAGRNRVEIAPAAGRSRG